jgi:hypothetical protein
MLQLSDVVQEGSIEELILRKLIELKLSLRGHMLVKRASRGNKQPLKSYHLIARASSQSVRMTIA